MWLQEADMKNRVNLNGTWQVQTKRGGPDLLQDRIRTKATNIDPLTQLLPDDYDLARLFSELQSFFGGAASVRIHSLVT